MITLLFSLLSANAATYAHLADLPELVASSSAVVRGVVVELRAERTGADLQTRYTVATEEVLRGEAPEQIEVVLPGGRQDGLVQRFAGAPLWEEGQEVVVFIGAPAAPVRSLQRIMTVDGDALVDSLDRAALPRSVDELSARVR